MLKIHIYLLGSIMLTFILYRPKYSFPYIFNSSATIHKYIILNQWTIFSNDRFTDVTRTGNKDLYMYLFILHIPQLHFRTGFEIVKCAISLALVTIIHIRYPQQCRILRYFDLRNFWYCCCCWNIHLKKWKDWTIFLVLYVCVVFSSAGN